MGRAANPFYYQNNPAPLIAGELVKAMFGDPTLRLQQQNTQSEMALRDAERQAAIARGSLDAAKTTGVDTQNSASLDLPSRIAALSAPPVVPVVVGADGSPGNFDAAFDSTIGRPTAEQAFNAGLPALIATLGQMQGDKVSTPQTVGTLASFQGGDELARRGLVAQGHTPGETFAVTPERADQIAATKADAAQRSAFGVATINHASDIPVAQVQAGARRYAADRSAEASMYGSDQRRDANEYGTDIKTGATAPGFDAIKRVFPNATMTSGLRSPEHNREVGGVSDSYHLGTHPGAIAYDIPVQPGMTVDEAARRIEAANPGVRVVEARDERGRTGPNGHALGGWHFALQGTAAAKGAKAPKVIPDKIGADGTNQTVAALTSELKRQGDGRSEFGDGWEKLPPNTQQVYLTNAAAEYHRTGDITGAVRHAFDHGLAGIASQQAAAGKITPRLWTNETADLFVSNPANKGKAFIAPDGSRRVVP